MDIQRCSLSSSRFSSTRRAVCEALSSRVLLFGGDLDPTFSGDGIESIQSGLTRAVAVQADGKTVVASDGDNVSVQVRRYTLSGSLDATFGISGVATIGFADLPNDYEDAAVHDIAVQNDGRIVVVGEVNKTPGSEFGRTGAMVARFNANGTPDNTFSGDARIVLSGIQTVSNRAELNAVAIQGNGKIVAVGSANVEEGLAYPGVGVLRINIDGTLDSTFSSNGQALIEFDYSAYGDAVSLTTDGKILFGGHKTVHASPYDDHFLYGRLNSNGSLDTSFSSDGFEVTPFVLSYPSNEVNGVYALPDGKVLIAGTVSAGQGNSNAALLRLNANGSRDTTFGANNGRFEFEFDTPGARDFVEALDISTTGKYLVSGGSEFDARVAMVNTDGTRDFGFGGDASLNLPVDAGNVADMALAQDNKVVGVTGGKVFRFEDRVGVTVGMFNFTPTLNEQGQTSVNVAVTRAEALPTALTVYLNLRGTATSPLEGVIGRPVDYSGTGIVLPGEFAPQPYVTIPANATTTTFTLTALEDNRVEGSETIAISLADVGTYDAFAPRTTTLTIADNDFSPEVTAREFLFQTSPHKVEFVFSQDVGSSLTASDFTVTGGPGTVPAKTLAYDPGSLTATLTFAGNILADGNYTVTLPANRVVNSVGNPNTASFSLNFHVLAGDANRDRIVDFADLVVLAQNYNASGRNFSQGNFNYSANGRVDFEDLVLLAQRYGSGPPALVDTLHTQEKSGKGKPPASDLIG